jgi:hypothetical protein
MVPDNTENTYEFEWTSISTKHHTLLNVRQIHSTCAAKRVCVVSCTGIRLSCGLHILRAVSIEVVQIHLKISTSLA